MTAVEWLIEQLTPSISLQQKHIDDLKEQAKQMEKEQKIEFAKHCLDRALDLDIRTAFFNVEEYYNQTYGKETDTS